MNDEVDKFDDLEVYLDLGILEISSWAGLNFFPGRDLFRMVRWQLQMTAQSGRELQGNRELVVAFLILRCWSL